MKNFLTITLCSFLFMSFIFGIISLDYLNENVRIKNDIIYIQNNTKN